MGTKCINNPPPRVYPKEKLNITSITNSDARWD